MDDAELIDLEVDLTGLHLADGLADLHRHRTGLGVRHQAARTQNTAQRADLAHHVRRTDDDVHVGPSALDLVHELVQTHVIGAGGLGLGLLLGRAEHQHAHRLAGSVRKRHHAADHLVRLARIDAQTDVDINRSVEFRERNFLQKSGCLGKFVSLTGFHLCVGDLLIFCQFTHLFKNYKLGNSPTTLIPMLRAVPATMRIAASSVKQFMSAILSLAIS